MKKIYQFIPSNENHNDNYYVLAQSKNDVERILLKHGFIESDMTSNQHLSRYYDCFLIREFALCINDSQYFLFTENYKIEYSYGIRIKLIGI